MTTESRSIVLDVELFRQLNEAANKPPEPSVKVKKNKKKKKADSRGECLAYLRANMPLLPREFIDWFDQYHDDIPRPSVGNMMAVENLILAIWAVHHTDEYLLAPMQVPHDYITDSWWPTPREPFLFGILVPREPHTGFNGELVREFLEAPVMSHTNNTYCFTDNTLDMGMDFVHALNTARRARNGRNE